MDKRMDKELFKRLADQVCSYFGETCRGCPFDEFRKSVDAPSCDSARKTHRKDAEIILATWIGGADFVKTLGEQKKKEPGTRREILEAAEKCVCGDRDEQYGSPENSFDLIAQLWEPIIRARCVSPGEDVTVDAVTVALLMAELKIARATTNETHMDSWVDLVGYGCCGGEIAARETDVGMEYEEEATHDREAWDPCEWCGEWLGGDCRPREQDAGYKLYAGYCKQVAADDFYEDETEELNYCPICGRPFTQKAWAELEKRLRG